MKKIFKIEGMSCYHCVMSVQKILSKLELKKMKVEIGSVTIDYDENKTNENEIIKAIQQAGYNIVKLKPI